jgi:hypothetical protein
MGNPLQIQAVNRFSSCTNDGTILYVYNESGLYTFGTGFGGTVAGALLSSSSKITNEVIFRNRRGWLCYCGGTSGETNEEEESTHLYLCTIGEKRELIEIDPVTLEVIQCTPIDEENSDSSTTSSTSNVEVKESGEIKVSPSNKKRKKTKKEKKKKKKRNDLIQKLKEAGPNAIVFTDGRLLYTLTPALENRLDGK